MSEKTITITITADEDDLKDFVRINGSEHQVHLGGEKKPRIVRVHRGIYSAIADLVKERL